MFKPVHSHTFLLGAILLALASGYLISSFAGADERHLTATTIDVVNESGEPLTITIREQRLFSLGSIEAGESRSRALPNIGLYEVRAANASGVVVASGMTAPSSSAGVRLSVKDGTIIEQTSPHDT